LRFGDEKWWQLHGYFPAKKSNAVKLVEQLEDFEVWESEMVATAWLLPRKKVKV
jgi:hypothetical protein